MKTLQSLADQANAIADLVMTAPTVENTAKLKDRCAILDQAYAYIAANMHLFKDLDWRSAKSMNGVIAEVPSDIVTLLNSFGTLESRKNGVNFTIKVDSVEVYFWLCNKLTSYMYITSQTEGDAIKFISKNRYKF